MSYWESLKCDLDHHFEDFRNEPTLLKQGTILPITAELIDSISAVLPRVVPIPGSGAPAILENDVFPERIFHYKMVLDVSTSPATSLYQGGYVTYLLPTCISLSDKMNYLSL